MIFKKKTQAVGYVRVSLETENYKNQVDAIDKFADENGYELYRYFIDQGVSGSQPALERPAFKEMLRIAGFLGIKTIIVYDLTRLGRDIFDVVNTYKYLLENGYAVLFVKHPELNARPDSPIAEAMRKALLTILGVVAELERALIIERTRAGLERAKKEGKRLGRKPVDIPVDKVKELLGKGLAKSDVWRLLVDMGYLRYREKGRERILSYDRFLKRLKAMGL